MTTTTSGARLTRGSVSTSAGVSTTTSWRGWTYAFSEVARTGDCTGYTTSTRRFVLTFWTTYDHQRSSSSGTRCSNHCSGSASYSRCCSNTTSCFGWHGSSRWIRRGTRGVTACARRSRSGRAGSCSRWCCGSSPNLWGRCLGPWRGLCQRF